MLKPNFISISILLREDSIRKFLLCKADGVQRLLLRRLRLGDSVSVLKRKYLNHLHQCLLFSRCLDIFLRRNETFPLSYAESNCSARAERLAITDCSSEMCLSDGKKTLKGKHFLLMIQWFSHA